MWRIPDPLGTKKGKRARHRLLGCTVRVRWQAPRRVLCPTYRTVSSYRWPACGFFFGLVTALARELGGSTGRSGVTQVFSTGRDGLGPDIAEARDDDGCRGGRALVQVVTQNSIMVFVRYRTLRRGLRVASSNGVRMNYSSVGYVSGRGLAPISVTATRGADLGISRGYENRMIAVHCGVGASVNPDAKQVGRGRSVRRKEGGVRSNVRHALWIIVGRSDTIRTAGPQAPQPTVVSNLLPPWRACGSPRHPQRRHCRSRLT